MSKRPHFHKLTPGTIKGTAPGLNQYKVWCPRCDYAAIASTSVVRCPYCGQAFCPPTQTRTFT